MFHNSTKKLCLGDLSISIAGYPVSRVGFSRLIVDEHLSFKFHIHHLISKISSNVGIISHKNSYHFVLLPRVSISKLLLLNLGIQLLYYHTSITYS